MKMSVKRFIAVLLSVIMCFLMCSCGKDKNSGMISITEGEYVSDTNLNNPGEFPICKEKITLKVGVPKDAKIVDYENNAYTRFLEEKSNIDLEFVYFPATALEARKKLDLMVSSGGKELPDILVGFDVANAKLYEYGKAGAIYDLTYFYENCSHYIDKMYEEHPDIKETELKSPDGKIYGIPRLSDNHYTSLSGYLWMYQPWLDKLGLKEPETIDEFKTVLKAFRDNDPNGNGIKDEIPFLGATDDMASRYLMHLGTPFLPVNTAQYYFYVDENEKIHAAYMEDEWKEMLKFLNELCKDDLFSPSTFTTTAEQFNQIARNSETVIGSMTVAPYIFETGDKRMDEYKIIGPLAGYDGTKRVMLSNYGYTCSTGAFIITKNCKYPEAAFRLGDFMCSYEATMAAKYGEEGTDWTVCDEGAVTNYDSLGVKASFKKLNDLSDAHSRTWGTYVWAGYATTDINLGAQSTGKIPSWKGEEFDNFEKYYENRYPYVLKLSYLEEDVERADELKYATSEYVNDMFAKFVLGREDIDSKWDEYKKTLKELGVDELIEIQQRAYNSATNKKN